MIFLGRHVSDHDRFRLNKKLAAIAERVDNGSLAFFKVVDALDSVLRGDFEEELSSGSQSLPVIINYNFPIAGMLMSGGYDRVAPNIDWKQFQPRPLGKQEVNIELINFHREVDTAEAATDLKTGHYRFLHLFELLALGAQYPEEQKRGRIVTIYTGGSDTDLGMNEAFVLHGRYRHRSLSHYFHTKSWPSDTRFAVVWDQFHGMRTNSG